MSMFTSTSQGDLKDNKQECELSAKLVSIYAKEDFHQEDGHSSDLDQKRSKPQGEWDRVAELMMIKFGENGHPSFPSHESICPEERSRAKEVENYQYTSALMRERLKLFFAQLFLLISSVSTEQSQNCVKNSNPAM